MSRSQNRNLRKLDNIEKNHLKESDFSGAARDLNGNPVPNGNGGYFDHLGEMRGSLKGLNKIQNSLNNSLRNPNLSNSSRKTIENALNKTNNYIQRIHSLGIK